MITKRCLQLILYAISACLLLSGCGGDSSGSSRTLQQMDDVPQQTDGVPVTSSVYPAIFHTGTDVKISGSHLDSVAVTLNGAAVEITSQNAHELHFLAPEWSRGRL